MVKIYEVEPDDRKVYYFTYSYNKNVRRINSRFYENYQENEIDYLKLHVLFTLEPHFLALAMLSEKQMNEVSSLVSLDKKAEAYNVICKYSKVNVYEPHDNNVDYV